MASADAAAAPSADAPAADAAAAPAAAKQDLPAGSRPRAFVDIDINDTRAAYQRAVDFVEARNLAYNLTSNRLEELGGSELKRIKEDLYPNDFEWASKGRICVKRPPERLVFELWPDVAPLAVTNFMSLCVGNKGKGSGGKDLHYRGCHLHRIIGGFIVQGGDILMNNGTGGESIYNGKPFKDDKDGLKKKVDRRGLLCMGNSGKNSNTSQFFVTLARDDDVKGLKKLAQLTGKHVVFGELLLPGGTADGSVDEDRRAAERNAQVLELVERCAQADVAKDGNKPRVPIVMADCGLDESTLSDLQLHQNGLKG